MPYLASYLYLAIHGVIILQPAGFEMSSKLDFVHLRGLADHIHETVKQDPWNVYHVGLML